MKVLNTVARQPSTRQKCLTKGSVGKGKNIIVPPSAGNDILDSKNILRTCVSLKSEEWMSNVMVIILPLFRLVISLFLPVMK